MLAEINNHENRVRSVCQSGEEMVQEGNFNEKNVFTIFHFIEWIPLLLNNKFIYFILGHFALNEIQKRLTNVSEKWQALKVIIF